MPPELLKLIALISIFAYLCYVFYMSIRANSDVKPSNAFFKTNDLVDTKTFVSSVAANFRDGSGVAAWVTFVVYFGFGSLWLAIGLSIGVFLLAAVVPVVFRNIELGEYSHPMELVRHQVGPYSATIFFFVTVFSAFVYSSAQVFVGGVVISSITGLSSNISLVLLGLTTGAYVILGGYRSVTVTDKFQWILIVALGALGLFFLQPAKLSQASTFFELDKVMVISLCGLSAMYAFTSGDLWQRILSVKSVGVAKKGLVWVGPVYFVFSLILVLGIMMVIPASLPEGAEPFQAVFDSSISGSSLSLFLGTLLIVSLMSTLDTQVFYVSSAISSASGLTEDRKKIFVARVAIFLSLTFACALAIFSASFLQLFFGAVTVVTTLIPIYLTIVFRDVFRSDIVASLSVVIGIIFYVVLFYGKAFETIQNTLIPGAAALGVLLLSSFVVRVLKQK